MMLMTRDDIDEIDDGKYGRKKESREKGEVEGNRLISFIGDHHRHHIG